MQYCYCQGVYNCWEPVCVPATNVIVNNQSPLVAKGDLYTFSTQDTRLPVGTNGSVLRANSATATGLEYTGNISPGVDANNFLGQDSGISLTTGSCNTAYGTGALRSVSSGNNNTGIGCNALRTATTASENTAVGVGALAASLAGTSNTAIGSGALATATTDSQTAIGFRALNANTTGTGNFGAGAFALAINSTGSNNTAVGTFALNTNTTGSNNIAIGSGAGTAVTTGANNILMGGAGINVSTGSGNIIIGNGTSGQNITSGSNNIVLGNVQAQNSTPTSVSGGGTFIGNIATTSVTGVAVYIDPITNLLGIVPSSADFKENIQNLTDDVSLKIYDLQPVIFNYRGDQRINYGLIAEQVFDVLPEIVVTTKNKPFTVRYDQLIPLLLSQVQSLRREVDELRKNNH